MTEPLNNIGELYAKEICALLPLHRLCIFLFCTIYSNYLLNETPLARWSLGDNIIPVTQSFWIYIQNKTLFYYFSIDNGILLHGKLSMYLLAAVITIGIYTINRLLHNSLIDLTEKIFPINSLIKSQRIIAEKSLRGGPFELSKFINILHIEKLTIQKKLKRKTFYSESEIGFLFITLISLCSTNCHYAIDIFMAILLTIFTATTNYNSISIYLKKYLPLAVHLQIIAKEKFNFKQDYYI